MNKETYEALKRVMNYIIKSKVQHRQTTKDIKQVEDWIDGVAKEYEEESKESKIDKLENEIGEFRAEIDEREKEIIALKE